MGLGDVLQGGFLSGLWRPRPACCKLSLSSSEWQRELWERGEIEVKEIEKTNRKERGQERAGGSKMIFTAAIKAPLW